jgi:hypothetical protein
VVLATIRADATVASKVDCLLGSTGFTLVCEEAATLVLAGLDFDIAEVIFFCETKSRPVVIVESIKQNTGIKAFLARGLQGVRAEFNQHSKICVV